VVSKRINWIALAALAVLSGFGGQCLADGTQDPDAPTWVWKSPDWNLDKNRLGDALNKFGKPTSWETQDAACGQLNEGYQFKTDDRTCYLVFYDSEDFAGFSLTTLPKYSTINELEFSRAYLNCKFSDYEKHLLPHPPFQELNGTFKPSIVLGSRETVLLAKLKAPASVRMEEGVKIYQFNWKTQKRVRNGDLDVLDTVLRLGFKNKILEYFDVQRSWED
jgi:hypothetical protein